MEEAVAERKRRIQAVKSLEAKSQAVKLQDKAPLAAARQELTSSLVPAVPTLVA